MSPFYIKEHTAQLSKRESLEYQKQFVKKELNALSCSTTFEMGVDVGGLETVYLRNVPPMPSNYAQRAGRAGRSKNSAAYAITYAKLSSHDFTFFNQPLDMIKGIILPPIFNIENEKVVLRHIFAIALSKYFQLFPQMYNSNKIENFIDDKGYDSFRTYLDTKPNELLILLENSIPKELYLLMGIEDFSWKDKLFGTNGLLSKAISEYEDIVKQYEKLIKNFAMDPSSKMSSYNPFKGNLKKFKDKQLIDFLARNNILPKYGFPVDTVELNQNTDTNPEFYKDLNLSRDLQLAISEYAPGSEIVADGKLYTSRYIKQSAHGEGHKHWETGYIAICEDEKCKALNYQIEIDKSTKYSCISCGQEIRKQLWKNSIEPRAGFISDKVVKPVPQSKPEKSYRSDDYYIGSKYSKSLNSIKIVINQHPIILETTQNDSLMVVTNDLFYVCKTCGYSRGNHDVEEIENAKVKQKHHGYIEDKKEHYTSYGSKCKNLRLDSYKLHHIFNTDVVKITFDEDTSDISTALSVLYALLDATSNILNIERKDIKGCLHKFVDKSKRRQNSFVLYDAVPGGVGHTRRLVSKNGEVIKNIVQRAFDNMSKCTCDPSCYSCLRNYANQKIHDQLDRIKAKIFLEIFTGGVESVEENFRGTFSKEIVVQIKNELEMKNPNWIEIHEYASDNISQIIEQCMQKDIILPDKLFGKLAIDNINVSYEFVWISRKVMILDEIQQELKSIADNQNDWLIFDSRNFNIEKMKERISNG